MKSLKDQIRDVINYDSESTVALPFEVKARLVNNITSTVEDYYAKFTPQKPSELAMEQKCSHPEFYTIVNVVYCNSCHKKLGYFDYGKLKRSVRETKP